MLDQATAIFGLLFEEQSDGAIVVHRADRRIVSANLRLADMLGVDRATLLGKDIDELVVADSDLRPDVLASAGHYEDVALAREDGYPLFVTLTVAHIDHPDGPMAACVARDMSARRNLERDLFAKHEALFAAHADLERMIVSLREAKAELEARNAEITMLAGQVSRFGWRAAVGELCASVAHHLNNPVGALTSTLRRLATRVDQVAEPGLRDDLVRLVERCRDVTRRIEGNVNMVVRTHRTGAADDEARWLELDHELAVALSLFADRLAGVAVSATTAPHRVHVPHDSLHHVLANLIDNALHALGGAGQLAVTIERRAGAHAIRVEDSGPGVDPALADKLFEPIIAARPGGAGLGLSTARRLARAWGGDVVDVPTPRGARFDVLIPDKDPP